VTGHLDPDALRTAAAAHLWRNFADRAPSTTPLRIMARGDGCYVEDVDGKRYLDGLSSLFCMNLGHDYSAELADAAAGQIRELAFQASWENTHVRAIELAAKLAELTPDGLDHTLFTSSGTESVEGAWKLARQHFALKGERRWKAIARRGAYHGATMGSLALNGIPILRRSFEPLIPAVAHVRNTNRFRRDPSESLEEFTVGLLDDLEETILAEDPATIAMVLIEPVQNRGGCLVAPPGYFSGVREICDRYGILLVADEVITAFGRIGAWFASQRLDLVPDIITTAKGLSAASASIGALIASEKVAEPFRRPGAIFAHGSTFGGHPAHAAIALKTLEIMHRDKIIEHVQDAEGPLFQQLTALAELPVVGDLRGCGFLYSLELVSDAATMRPLTPDRVSKVFGTASLEEVLADRGLICRASISGDEALVTLAPPLVADTAEFNEIGRILTDVLEALS
jgi:adenosylmethionine-8-amino-7-oxononanoate aminotransferase